VSRVVLVHGIAQQYKGAESLRAVLAPALCDGVSLTGGRLTVDDVGVAFYGDLFRPKGSRSIDLPDYDSSDVDDPFEQDLLRLWWQEEPGTRVRTAQWVQRALYAVDGMSFFQGLTERALIGSLKQVRAYFTDPDIRHAVRQRVLDAVADQTRVLVGHSLGSVVAYEALCAERTSVKALVTLGSPLGIPNLVYDRLMPKPGAWPGVTAWTNIADRGDVVALVKELGPLFGPIRDVLVHNGAKAHDMRPYLTARETGLAVLQGCGHHGEAGADA
jgi:pimeloyl-ACP methyl ester carboxylesterase